MNANRRAGAGRGARPRAMMTIILAVALSAGEANAWLAKGHERIADLGVTLTGGQLPAFFREGRLQIIHNSVDPDLFCDRVQAPVLASTEGPDHYLDWELIGEHALPANRAEFVVLCQSLHVAPGKVGALPYALVEWTEALTLALAEYRRWPENPRIATKCLVYAGLLAHYAGDASQPLHLTIHYDGRVGADGVSPTNGIHLRVDALAEKLDVRVEELLEGLSAVAFANTATGIEQALRASHGFVDRVYALELRVPALESPIPEDDELRAFVHDRVRAGAALLASLYLTAWERSGTITLPAWHGRTESRFEHVAPVSEGESLE
ncbi:MAG: hypothetical protein O3B24_08780 [Verrucomicrobia bacterium]|nr:hypothetical protein [Verrucomicrobiota bacterium]